MAERKRSKPGRCKTAGCKNKSQSRGLCQTCLREAWDMIYRGAVTEDQLVARGKMNPRQRAGRPRISKFVKQLDR